MVLLTILAILIVIVAIIAISFVGIFGGTLLLVFGDLIVFGLIVYGLVKLFSRNKKK
jgi:hypothetical protein